MEYIKTSPTLSIEDEDEEYTYPPMERIQRLEELYKWVTENEPQGIDCNSIQICIDCLLDHNTEVTEFIENY